MYLWVYRFYQSFYFVYFSLIVSTADCKFLECIFIHMQSLCDNLFL
ncbi:hypothetical protein ECDEC10A_5780 [Escherichia coli DEC10A]|nr:hypothetical protein ECDEC10A_5780 [Escherichia coli DEC10A]